MTDPRITELWLTLDKAHQFTGHQWWSRRLWMQHFQHLSEELFRDDIELYKQFIHQLARKAFPSWNL
jgi:hypothetical protein